MGKVLLSVMMLFALVMSSFCATPRTSADVLFYLNRPESVRKAGILGSGVIYKGQRARIFFHYVSRLSSSQKFSVILNKPVIGFRGAFHQSPSPSYAGLVANKNFLAATPSMIPDDFKIVTTLSPGVTLSGMMEFTALEDTEMTCSLGGGPILADVNMSIVDFINHDETLIAKEGTVSSYSLGERGTLHPIIGGYGISHRFKIKSESSKKIKVKVVISPRGGVMRLPFKIDGMVSVTPTIRAKKMHTLYTRTLLPGEEFIIETIPVGGFSYPVKFYVSATVV